MRNKPQILQDGKISGRVIDSVSSHPIEYSTISLLTDKEGKIINGTTTDSKGLFKLADVTAGNYKLIFYSLGYKLDTINNIMLIECKSHH